MTTCSICLETDTNEIYTTICGHIFHKHCIYIWLKEQTTCPMCRQEQIILYMIHHMSEIENTHYKFINHNGNSGSDDSTFQSAYKQLLNQAPQGWINMSTREDYSLGPVYVLEIEGVKTYIDYYVRQLLMFHGGEFDTKQIIERKGLDTVYSTSTQVLSARDTSITLSYKSYEIIVDWIYDVMHLLKKNYDFVYTTTMNTLILDLITMTILELGILKKNNYQTAIIAAIYTTIKFYEDKEVDRCNLIDLTKNSSDMDVLNTYIYFQEMKMEKDFIRITNSNFA